MASVEWSNKFVIQWSLNTEPPEIQEACKDAIKVVKALSTDGTTLTYTITLPNKTVKTVQRPYIQ